MCCFSKSGAAYICPFLLERSGSLKLGRPKLCQSQLEGKQRPGNHGRSCWPGVAVIGVGYDCKRAPPCGSAEAEAAATEGLNGGERALPRACCSAEAAAAARWVHYEGKRAPPGGSAEGEAAAARGC